MDEIMALEDRRIEAMISGDVEALGEILADDLIYTHTTARLDTKASFIEAIASGRSNYRAVERKDVEFRGFGSRICVVIHIRIDFIVEIGKEAQYVVRIVSQELL